MSIGERQVKPHMIDALLQEKGYGLVVWREVEPGPEALFAIAVTPTEASFRYLANAANDCKVDWGGHWIYCGENAYGETIVMVQLRNWEGKTTL